MAKRPPVLADPDAPPRPAVPQQIRHSPETKALAVALMRQGLSAIEAATMLPVDGVSWHSVVRWYVADLDSSETDALTRKKLSELPLLLVLALEPLLAAEVSAAERGDGKGVAAIAVAIGIHVDKVQLLLGKPSALRFGRHEQVITHQTAPDPLLNAIEGHASASSDT